MIVKTACVKSGAEKEDDFFKVVIACEHNDNKKHTTDPKEKLRRACWAGDPETVTVLVHQIGLDLDTVRETIRARNLPLVRLFVSEFGLSPDLVLVEAARMGSCSIPRWLLTEGGGRRIIGTAALEQALLEACAAGCLEVVRLLVTTTKLKQMSHDVALKTAHKNGHMHIVHLLTQMSRIHQHHRSHHLS
jgi:hypothetical protein